VQSVGGGARWLWLATLVQRLLTFTLNSALLRFTSADVVGFASNDMELLLSTIVFLSREGARMVALRAHQGVLDAPASLPARQLVNLAWLPVLPGALASSAAAAWFFTRDAGAGALPGERHAALLYCAAAALELASEPLAILSAAQLAYGARARTEIGASFVKCGLTFALAAWGGLGALAFAWGQVAYAACLCIGYAVHMRSRLRASSPAVSALSLLPCRLPSAPGVSGLASIVGLGEATLLTAFLGQSVLKHALTEMDRGLLAGLSTRADRGAYAVAANYGGLAARLLFAPLEEGLRGMTAKLGSSEGGRAIAADMFLRVTRGVLLVGALLALFGHFFAGSLVRAALGAWAATPVPHILAAYAVYLLVLALNGVTEAFATGAADAGRLGVSSVHLALAAAACTGAALWALPVYGSVSLVWINCANMGLRTLSSCVYIASLLRRVREGRRAETKGHLDALSQALPSWRMLAALALSTVILGAAEGALSAPAALVPLTDPAHVRFLATGLCTGLALLGCVWSWEGRALRDTLRALRGGAGEVEGQTLRSPRKVQ
jgi:oligosaccharide translocation protein RFT1